MLAFIDESYQRVETTDEYFTSYSAVCVRRESSRDLSRELFNLKRKFWKIADPTIKELKGSLLLTERALISPKNREFVSEIMALLRIHDARLFAVIHRGPLVALKNTRGHLHQPFQFLMERVNKYTADVASDASALMVYDSVEDKTNRAIATTITNFLYRASFGQSFENILDFVTFGDSTTTPGLQIADLVAYCANTRYMGRRGHLETIFQEMRNLTVNWKDARGPGKTDWGFKFIGQYEEAEDTS